MCTLTPTVPDDPATAAPANEFVIGSCAVTTASAPTCSVATGGTDTALCAAVTVLDSATACEAVMTSDATDASDAQACTYAPAGTCLHQPAEIAQAALAPVSFRRSLPLQLDLPHFPGFQSLSLTCYLPG